MVKENLILLLPEIILAAAAIIVMLSIAIKRSHRLAFVITGLAIIGSILSLGYIDTLASTHVTTLFVVDGFGYFFSGLVLTAALVITLFSYPYFRKRENERQEEYYVLLLVATLGATSMTISNNFISFFLSLEVMSVPLYALIAYLKKNSANIEAGIKYLIMAAVSAAILLFGFALIYAQTGQMELDKITSTLTADGASSPLFITGIALVIAGIGFKLALVPFHYWTPDIYAGAPAPVSAFISTISKGAVFAFLLRLFFSLGAEQHESVVVAFTVLSIASMLIGNWLALRQKNIKRLLAYSSIGHLGYLIIPLLAASQAGTRAAAFYLVTYFIAMLGAFGIVSYLSGRDTEIYDLDDYQGLFWKKPWLAGLFTVIMFSLAGIPLTAGFLGKFYLLLSGVGSHLWLLVIVLVVASGMSIFYYLRVVYAMASKKKALDRVIEGHRNPGVIVVLVALFILILWIGIYPSQLLDMIDKFVAIF